jgi:hypothetical protein
MKNTTIQTLLAMAVSLSLGESTRAASFGEDVAFLRQHTDVLVLSDSQGQAKVAVVPGWQGRVMTSAAAGDEGRSFGWINRELLESGKLQPHMNAFGGEDRFWMGPEGGQFSIYFAKGAKFEFANWFVPAVFDTLPYKLDRQAQDRAAFSSEFTLTNYSGTVFEVGVQREIRLLAAAAAWKKLGARSADGVQLVAYESDNRITNRGRDAWKKDTGLLSIWILGMFTPSPHSTIVVPIKPGPEAKLGVKVTSDYFGAVPPDRLKVEDRTVFLSGDGKFRSKIGINPKRSQGVLGAYDADHQVLTIVQFDQPKGVIDYVNSLWKLQDNPYGGDVANSYNDGPPTPGAKPMGPFFEMESSSPAASLAPGGSMSHVHRTLHLIGPEASLDAVARSVLGVSIAQIKSAFHSNP